MPSVTTKKLGALIQEMTTGALQVPNFQRDFVWTRGQVLALLESIRCSIPIGTITVWEQSVANATLFEPFFSDSVKGGKLALKQSTESGSFDIEKLQTIDHPADAKSGVIDGRQRLTSLLVSFGGITFGAVNHRLAGVWALDLKADFSGEATPFEFIRIRDVERKYKSQGDWIRKGMLPLWVWQDVSAFTAELVNSAHYEGGKIPADVASRIKQVTSFQKTIGNFDVAVYSLEATVDLSAVCEIFEILNTSGTKVGVYDIVNAKLFGNSSGVPFDLKQRVTAICRDGISPRKEYLSRWFDENGGIGGKTVPQVVTGLYLGDIRNLEVDASGAKARRKIKDGGIHSFKGGDLISTPLEFYLEVFDKDSQGNDVSGFPFLAKLDQFAKDFMILTAGVTARNSCPYPIMFASYCSLRHQANLLTPKIAQAAIDEAMRVFFWRACFDARYDQGFLTGAVKDRDLLLDFLTASDGDWLNDQSNWWGGLETCLKEQLKLVHPGQGDLAIAVSEADPKGARERLLHLLLYCRLPIDLKDKTKLTPHKRNDIELHHIFPRSWVQNNCADLKDKMDSYAALIPMSAASNLQWSAQFPRQCLEAWNPDLTWTAREQEMMSVGINQAAYTALIDKTMPAKDQVEAFLSARSTYLAEQLDALMKTAPLPAGLKAWKSAEAPGAV